MGCNVAPGLLDLSRDGKSYTRPDVAQGVQAVMKDFVTQGLLHGAPQAGGWQRSRQVLQHMLALEASHSASAPQQAVVESSHSFCNLGVLFHVLIQLPAKPHVHRQQSSAPAQPCR